MLLTIAGSGKSAARPPDAGWDDPERSLTETNRSATVNSFRFAVAHPMMG
jgi:hypothetical protein